jgi:uncharacterized membrane protein
VNTVSTPRYIPNPQTLSVNSGEFGITGLLLHGKILVFVLVKNQKDKNIRIINAVIVHLVGLKKCFQPITSSP